MADYAEAARVLGLTRARLTQATNLLLLAPEIQEAILSGHIHASERNMTAAVAEPEWAHQLEHLADGGEPGKLRLRHLQ